MDDAIDKSVKDMAKVVQAVNQVRTEENEIDKLIADRIINQDVSDDITKSGRSRKFTCVNMNEFIKQVKSKAPKNSLVTSDRAWIFEEKLKQPTNGAPLSSDNETERDQGTPNNQPPTI